MKCRVIIFFILICFQIIAQKPKKIFSYLQNKQLILAVEEYNKISKDIEYDNEEKMLFKIAFSLFLIDSNYQIYNPIKSFNNFYPVYNISNQESRASIEKFLLKYDYTIIKINENINEEIYKEATKINSVDAFKNALEVYNGKFKIELLNHLEIALFTKAKSEKNISEIKKFIIGYPNSIYKNELQILLENQLLSKYKVLNNIDSLNLFIKQYKNSSFYSKAINLRDSIALTKVPIEYDSLLDYTKKYPQSKFNIEIEKTLPDLLYETIKSNNYPSNFCSLFISNYPNDKRVNDIDDMLFNRAKTSDSLKYYREYLNTFNYGKYLKNVKDFIKNKELTKYKILNIYNIDSLLQLVKYENIYEFKQLYFNKLYSINNILDVLKEGDIETNQKNIKKLECKYNISQIVTKEEDSILNLLINKIRLTKKMPSSIEFNKINLGKDYFEYGNIENFELGKINPISNSIIDENFQYSGKIKEAVTWNDLKGEHIVFTTESGVFHSKSKQYNFDVSNAEIYYYHYVKEKSDFQVKQIRHYFVNDCVSDVKCKFIKNNIEITDVNKNGIPEIWLGYRLICRSDVSPSEFNIIVFEDEKESILKGYSLIKIGSYTYGNGEIEDRLNFSDDNLLLYAKKKWKINVNESND
jgi:hypothetical protein